MYGPPYNSSIANQNRLKYLKIYVPNVCNFTSKCLKASNCDLCIVMAHTTGDLKRIVTNGIDYLATTSAKLLIFSQIFIKENNCGTVKPKVLNDALSNHHPPKMSKYCLLHCCICYTIIIKGSNEFDKEM